MVKPGIAGAGIVCARTNLINISLGRVGSREVDVRVDAEALRAVPLNRGVLRHVLCLSILDVEQLQARRVNGDADGCGVAVDCGRDVHVLRDRRAVIVVVVGDDRRVLHIGADLDLAGVGVHGRRELRGRYLDLDRRVVWLREVRASERGRVGDLLATHQVVARLTGAGLVRDGDGAGVDVAEPDGDAGWLRLGTVQPDRDLVGDVGIAVLDHDGVWLDVHAVLRGIVVKCAGHLDVVGMRMRRALGDGDVVLDLVPVVDDEIGVLLLLRVGRWRRVVTALAIGRLLGRVVGWRVSLRVAAGVRDV